MAKTQFNVDQFRTEALKPFLAAAGATELAVTHARTYAAEAQKSVAKASRGYRDRKSLQTQLSKEAKQAQARFEARITQLQKDARDFPSKFETALDDAVSELSATYADLAQRGEKLVDAVRKDGLKAVTSLRSVPGKSTVVRRERAVAAADKAPARKSTAKKSTAKKAPAKKSTAKRAPAKRSTAKKAPARKSTTTTTA